jgi:nucleotide-binding universal stress UspA family protein
MQHAATFQRILVGLDPEGDSCGAAIRACRLAHREGATVHFVHAVSVPAATWPGVLAADAASLRAEALAHARERQMELLRTALREADIRRDITDDDLRVQDGFPGPVILKAAEDMGADLLLMGPHVRRSLFDFGSTLRALLGRATQPLWMQPRDVQRIQGVVAATDFSEHGDSALATGERLAKDLGVPLRVLHCAGLPSPALTASDAVVPAHILDSEVSSARERLDDLVASRRDAGVDASPVFVEGTPMEGILGTAHEGDIVVIGTHGRTGLSRFLLGSTAHSVLTQTKQPVIVVPATRSEWLLDAPKH